MKIKEFLIEAIEKGEKSDKEKSDNKTVTPPKNNDKDEKIKTSLLKNKIVPEKKIGAMIYDKIINTIQVVQFDNHDDLEDLFELNNGAMTYVEDMSIGETHDDKNSILTIIWKNI